MSVSSSAPQVVVVRAPRRFRSLSWRALHSSTLRSPSHASTRSRFPSLNSWCRAILVSIYATRCFNLHNCHPRLTLSSAKGNKDAGDGMASAELVVCITGDEKFRRITTARTSKLRFVLVEDAGS